MPRIGAQRITDAAEEIAAGQMAALLRRPQLRAASFGINAAEPRAIQRIPADEVPVAFVVRLAGHRVAFLEHALMPLAARLAQSVEMAAVRHVAVALRLRGQRKSEGE
jgi:hypothetical protein